MQGLDLGREDAQNTEEPELSWTYQGESWVSCNQRGQRGRCCCDRGLGNLGLAHNAGCNTSSSGEALGTAQDRIKFTADVASNYLVRKSARSCLNSKQRHNSEL